jgi:anti-anti-sigma factor
MKYVTGTRSVDPQTTVVTCQGEMDSLAVEELHQAVDPLLADSVAHLVFDLAAVEYVSSSILSFLMGVNPTNVTPGAIRTTPESLARYSAWYSGPSGTCHTA